MLFPSDRPSSGNLRGPKMIKAMMKMTINSGIPSEPIIAMLPRETGGRDQHHHHTSASFRPKEIALVPGTVAHSHVREFLQALPLVRLRDEQVALRIDGEVVGAVELSGPVAGTSEGAHHLEGIALEHMHLLVGAVGNEQELLTRIDGESDVPH